MSDASAPLETQLAPKRSAEPHHAHIVYERSASVAEQMTSLAELHARDKKAEKRKTILGWTGGLCLVPGIFLSFTPLIIVGLPLVILGGVLLIVRAALGKNDIDDRKLHAARRVIEVLGPELKPGRPVGVHLDFGSYAKAIPTSYQHSGGNSVAVYEKPGWLKMRFTLLDGTEIKLTASTSVKRKKRRKRKYTKIKDRVVDELEVVLRAPRGQVLTNVNADKLQNRFKGRHALLLKSCRVKPRIACLSFETPVALRLYGRSGWQGTSLENLLDGHHLLEAVLASYRGVAAEARERSAA